MLLEFIDPGKLRIPLELQQIVDVADGQGGITRSYSTLANVYGHINPVGSRRTNRGHGDEVTTTHRIIVRYRTDIAPDQRFISNNRSFDIQTVRDLDESQRFLLCECVEIV